MLAVGQDAEEVGGAGQRAFAIGHYHLDAVRHNARRKVVPSFILSASSPAFVHVMLREFRKLSSVRQVNSVGLCGDVFWCCKCDGCGIERRTLKSCCSRFAVFGWKWTKWGIDSEWSVWRAVG